MRDPEWTDRRTPGSETEGAGPSRSGVLAIVPTPLGNLGDITLRALEALREADIICAEDTRVTGKLLAALGVERGEKRLERMDENTIAERIDRVRSWLDAGEAVAFCSDAGMPGVSDPGSRLIRGLRDAGYSVEVLPGASAAVTAYVASGTPWPSYYFGGFFPRKPQERIRVLEELSHLEAALVFYESPKRLVSALASIARCFPLRQVTVCRELTKLHEEIARGDAGGMRDRFAAREEASPIRGEVVIVIDGPSSEEAASEASDAREAARRLAEEMVVEGVSQKQIMRALQERLSIPRNDAYGIALDARRSHGS